MMILANVLALVLIGADEPQRSTAPTTTRKAETPEIWQLTLPEAIRIGLENAPVVRVIRQPGKPELVIAPLKADRSAGQFKEDLLAHVRSIEQQYWALSMCQVQVWARETAVKLTEEILAVEKAKQAEGGKSTLADIAEVTQHLENSKLNLISATSDLMTTERQLRNILGLPAHDDRRIVACTAPSEAYDNPDWETCVASMEDAQPMITEQRQALGAARLKALIEAEKPSLTADQKEALKAQAAKQQELLIEIRHQATHSLARFFLEIDTNHQQLQAARKLRDAGLSRLEAQRDFYEEGRITVDRLLDAVVQYANAVGQEALYKSTYNTSIAALAEAQGTLLADRKIVIAEKAGTTKSGAPGKDEKVAPASFDAAPPAPVAPSLSPVPPVPSKVSPTATTYKLKAKFGPVKFIEIELEVLPGSN